MSEDVSNSAELPEREKLLSRFSDFSRGVLDNISFLLFCVSFSSLTHLLGSLWSRLLTEK